MNAVRMNFGKHRGQPINEVPDTYLEWALRECVSLGARMRRAIENELDRRFAASGAEVKITTPPAELARLIVRWHRAMAMRFHPDRGGSNQEMKVVNAGVDLFRELAGGQR